MALLLKHRPESEQGWFYRKSEHLWKTIIEAYGNTLQFVLKHQYATLMVALATIAVTGWLFYIIPKGFFPVQDTGEILGISEASQDISFTAMSPPARSGPRNSQGPCG